MNEATDCTINLSFTMYYSWWSRVIGWVTHGKRMINTNRKYFYYPVDFAANAIHEYMHMTGFDHRNASDSGSVPYKVGTLFQVWAYKKYGNERN
jgi:hypothetical protein